MLVGIFPVYSILNCNLVCIRNGAHVNKAWWGSTHFPCPCLNSFYCCKNIKMSSFHECCGSTGTLLTAHIAMRGVSSPARIRSQLSPALHVMLIHKLTCQLFSKTVWQSACAWTTLTSHSLQKINLFLMSVWREQQNNSMFLSSSWKSSCTMFVGAVSN